MIKRRVNVLCDEDDFPELLKYLQIILVSKVQAASLTANVRLKVGQAASVIRTSTNLQHSSRKSGGDLLDV